MKILHEEDGLTLTIDDGRYYLLYDAGSHQVAMRKDEITEQEAQQILADPAEATPILFRLQRKLEASGVDPYVSNV